MTDPNLLAAIHDLHDAIIKLTAELRRHRYAEQADLETIIALHKKPALAITEEQKEQCSFL